MPSINIIKKIEGLQTLESIQKKLGISKLTAVKYMHLLKKKGYVETSGGGKQPRFYMIDALKPAKFGNPGFYEIINEYSPIKIRVIRTRTIGKKITIEEALVRAVDSRDFRIILASLALFNHIKNWSRLYKYAKMYNVRKKIGALYDIARTLIKIRRMDKRIYLKLLNTKGKEGYIIGGLRSKDYKDIESKWGVYLPFNKSDLMRYKE